LIPPQRFLGTEMNHAPNEADGLGFALLTLLRTGVILFA